MLDQDRSKEQLLEELHALRARLSQLEQEADGLRRSEARFRSLFHSPMIGLIFWDAAGRITDANDAFLRAVGFPRDELLAGTVGWRDMTPPEYHPLAERATGGNPGDGRLHPR